MNRPMSFLAGALCGAVVGAVASLLLTPLSGRDLQVKARTEVENILLEAKDAAAARREELRMRLEELQLPRGVDIE